MAVAMGSYLALEEWAAGWPRGNPAALALTHSADAMTQYLRM